ncbi:MAG: TlpA family protein disulfide reductase [Planctomycetales bacterium]|nr:TlpA family protein disulfide reductase [Planctomycetales bacterium]
MPRVRLAHFLLLLVAIAVGCGRSEPSTASLPLGSALPPLSAQGWINGPPPEPSDLRERAVVIVAWAYWCAPCLQEMPQLVNIQQELSELPVQFIALTAVEEDGLEETRLQLVRHQVTWPNGYGAASSLKQLGISAIPALMVFDRQGRLTWQGEYAQDLAEAIQAAMAE